MSSFHLQFPPREEASFQGREKSEKQEIKKAWRHFSPISRDHFDPILRSALALGSCRYSLCWQLRQLPRPLYLSACVRRPRQSQGGSAHVFHFPSHPVWTSRQRILHRNLLLRLPIPSPTQLFCTSSNASSHGSQPRTCFFINSHSSPTSLKPSPTPIVTRVDIRSLRIRRFPSRALGKRCLVT